MKRKVSRVYNIVLISYSNLKHQQVAAAAAAATMKNFKLMATVKKIIIMLN